jgi:hypothetical protein
MFIPEVRVSSSVSGMNIWGICGANAGVWGEAPSQRARTSSSPHSGEREAPKVNAHELLG